VHRHGHRGRRVFSSLVTEIHQRIVVYRSHRLAGNPQQRAANFGSPRLTTDSIETNTRTTLSPDEPRPCRPPPTMITLRACRWRRAYDGARHLAVNRLLTCSRHEHCDEGTTSMPARQRPQSGSTEPDCRLAHTKTTGFGRQVDEEGSRPRLQARTDTVRQLRPTDAGPETTTSGADDAICHSRFDPRRASLASTIATPDPVGSVHASNASALSSGGHRQRTRWSLLTNLTAVIVAQFAVATGTRAPRLHRLAGRPGEAGATDQHRLDAPRSRDE